MPETYLTDVPARAVRAGDLLDTGRTVTGCRTGTRWTHIDVGGEARPWRVAADEPVTVARQRPTPAERRQQMTRLALESLNYTAHRDALTFAACRDRMAAALAADTVPTWSDLDDLPALCARLDLWRWVDLEHRQRVLATVDGWTAAQAARWEVTGSHADVPSRLDALPSVADEVRERLLSQAAHLGGSSDPGTRFLAAADTAGRAGWLRDLRGFDTLGGAA
ncbi:hypothetical protein GCM10027261_14180 [Geodermatophilus arenarius]|uniref:DUF222 domain-containing protein n=1 Tax=Geodermatophilus arenarius TaxID=1137990 RepID=A0ABV9LJA2_9ACTN